MTRATYSVDGRLGRLLIRGAKVRANVAEAVTKATLSLSSSAVTQLDLSLVDSPDFKLLDSGLFAPGTPTKAGSRCDYGDLALEVRAVEVAPRGEDHALKVTARSLGAGRLRRARGELIRRNLSPTSWAALEAKAAGLRFVGQPSAARRQIVRQVGKSPESSWDTLQRLASELGYVCFEAAGVLYFGQPTWLVDRTRRLPLTWKGDRTDDALDALPVCRRSGDDKRNVAELTAVLRGELGEAALPGMAAVLAGVPTFDGVYMVNDVTLDLAEGTGVKVTAATPVNPKPQPPDGNGKDAGDGRVKVPAPSRDLRVKGEAADRGQLANATAIYRVGRDMGIPLRGIVIAVATAIQESTLTNLTGGDRDSVGLFQQRPSQGWGTVAELTDPETAARKFYLALRKVPGWEALTLTAAAQAVQRSAYPGAYAQWETEARRIVQAIEATRSEGDDTVGDKSAAAFVGLCLEQAGDTYIYGTEVDLDAADPDAFDCSELIEWALARVGVKFVDGSANQIARCKAISVAEGIDTKGALLYKPGHIAVSLGNGKTIEAANRTAGVVSYGADGRGFTRAGLVPGLRY